MVWALLPVFLAGNADNARPAEIQAVAEAQAPQAQAQLAQTPESSPSPTPEPSPDSTPSPTPMPAATPEPPPKREVLSLPEIPADAPAPPQIKSLPDSGMVCLTFDDGYNENAVGTILDCLQQNDVQCTFFVVGVCLKEYPELWKRAVAEGHEIAYHTMRHRPLDECSNRQIVSDINEWNETAYDVLGPGYHIPKIARAPGGRAGERVRRLFYCLGYRLIYWSSDTFSGVYQGNRSNAEERIASYMIELTEVGAISLQHFNRYDASSVSGYIAELKAKFTLGTVSQALARGEAMCETTQEPLPAK